MYHVPNHLLRLCQRISRSPRHIYPFRNKACFYGKALLGPRPTPKLEDHTLSTFCDCLFNIFAATSHIGGRSSIRNLRTHHVFVTWTHLSWLLPKLMNAGTYPWENSRTSARPSPAPSYAIVFLDHHSPGEVMAPNSLLMVQLGVLQRRWNMLIVWLYGSATFPLYGMEQYCRHQQWMLTSELLFSKMVPQRTQYANQLTDWIFSRFGEIAWCTRSPNLP